MMPSRALPSPTEAESPCQRTTNGRGRRPPNGGFLEGPSAAGRRSRCAPRSVLQRSRPVRRQIGQAAAARGAPRLTFGAFARQRARTLRAGGRVLIGRVRADPVLAQSKPGTDETLG